MSMTDTISDMLTRIRNSIVANYEKVDVIASRTNLEIASILKREGYIKNYRIIRVGDDNIRNIRIYLRYSSDNANVIRELKRVSKPGRRIYVKRKEIPNVLNGLGIAIVSTNKGILTDEECRRQNVGGEVLCYVW